MRTPGSVFFCRFPQKYEAFGILPGSKSCQQQVQQVWYWFDGFVLIPSNSPGRMGISKDVLLQWEIMRTSLGFLQPFHCSLMFLNVTIKTCNLWWFLSLPCLMTPEGIPIRSLLYPMKLRFNTHCFLLKFHEIHVFLGQITEIPLNHHVLLLKSH